MTEDTAKYKIKELTNRIVELETRLHTATRLMTAIVISKKIPKEAEDFVNKMNNLVNISHDDAL